MKLKAQQVFDATLVLAQIIRENRPMPQTGNYWLARLHRMLMPEFAPISERRDAMITAYGHHPMVPGPKTAEDPFGEQLVPSTEFGVPADKLAEFAAAWNEIGDQEIEVNVEPVSLAYLDLGAGTAASIKASELVTLGDLVRE